MSPSLVALTVLVAFLGLRFLIRGRGAATRPIFGQNDIFAGRLTEGLLHALVSDRGFVRSDTRIAGFFGPAIMIDRDGACGRLILHPALGFGRENDLPGLRTLAAHCASDRSTTIVVVGGGREFGRTALAATAPVRTLHVGDDGALSEARRRLCSGAPRRVVENALDRMAAELTQGAFPTLDLETARSLVVSDSELEEGLRPTAPSRGVVTTALSLAIVLCFAGEVAITRDALKGDGATLAVAYRMGAIYQPAVLAGEWLRLIAAPFIHFGVLHLAMNGWAQWSLGGPIEFLVGPWGFLALWVGSALGASITSVILNEASVAAGASGAIFGLLGAFTTFVFFRKDVLPQPVPRPLRNGVLATLLLNLMISFIPSIDMAAHAGGFLTGAMMAFGLVRRDRAAPSSAPRALWLRLAVAGIVIVGVGSISLQERADLATRAPQVQSEHRVGEIRLPIPDGFAVSESRAQGLVTVEADGTPASPFLLTYRVSEPQADEAAAQRVLQGLRSGPGAAGPADWVALSRLGVENLRAIEIVVVAPASRRAAADALGAAIAARIR